jgi:hypothetical protein
MCVCECESGVYKWIGINRKLVIGNMNDKMMGDIGEEISYVQRASDRQMNHIYNWAFGKDKL